MDLDIIIPAAAALHGMRARERWQRSELDAYRARELRKLRVFACQHSAFYREFHAGLSGRPLEELPVLTKPLLMEHFNDLVTDRALRRDLVEQHLRELRGSERLLGRYWDNATSGSTGRPGLFVFGRKEWATTLASYARAPRWAGLRANPLSRPRMAIVSSTTPWHNSARIANTIGSSLHLDPTSPLDSLVDALNGFSPQMLSAYATMAGILAGEQLAGRLRIHPAVVVTSSEVLTDHARRTIEQAWGRPPFNEYVATEACVLGLECDRHTGLHLFEDLVIFEVVDKNNQAVRPGTFGSKLLVTVLYSRTLPLIRYQLSDSLRLAADPCPCGRPFAVADGIQGRAEEILQLPTRPSGHVQIHPVLIHKVMDATPAAAWQVIQEPGRLRVLVAGAQASFDLEVMTARLRKALEGQGAAPLEIMVEHVAAIPRGGTGKAVLIRPLLQAQQASAVQGPDQLRGWCPLGPRRTFRRRPGYPVARCRRHRRPPQAPWGE